jgi:hypothetical protein
MAIVDAYALASLEPRRGISTPALLVTLSIAILLAAAALDLAQLSHQRHQIQIGADAAVLAAAPHVMDRGWLYLGPEGSNDPNLEDTISSVRMAQLEAAQQHAIFFAGLNKVAKRSILLDENPNNDRDGDIFVGFTPDPAVRELDGLPGPDGGFNSLIVRASRRKAAGDLPLLWLARHVGLHELDMKVYSQATVDQRVFGFRPLTHVPIPILPLAVLPRPDDLSMFPPEAPIHLWWAKGPNDSYTVDPIHRIVSPGADGIAEIVIRVHSQSSGNPSNNVKTRRGVLLGFGSGGDCSPASFAQISTFGLTSQDLPYGELAIVDQNDPPAVAAEYNVDSADLMDICGTLREAEFQLLGAPRIIPLGVPISSSQVGIVGFVAGTIVHCEQDLGDDSLLIVIQPCLLQSPTALVGGDNPRNPWIGKLLLNR